MFKVTTIKGNGNKNVHESTVYLFSEIMQILLVKIN